MCVKYLKSKNRKLHKVKNMRWDNEMQNFISLIKELFVRNDNVAYSK